MHEDLVELVTHGGGIRAGIDRRTGALRDLSGGGDWRPLSSARSARPFDLLIPLPGRRRNRTREAPQRPPRVTVSGDGASVLLDWDSVVSEHGGTHDISVSARYALDGEALVCAVTVRNDSQLVVENVAFPCLTDLQPPDRASRFGTFSYAYGTARRHQLWPRFDNLTGYYGFDRPTYVQEQHAMAAAPSSPFILLEGPGCGLYVGVDEPRTDLLTWFAELEPGYGESMGSLVPVDPAVGGKEVRIEFAPVHLPYLLPGERRTLSPIRLACYAGDWHAGAGIYRARRKTWMGSSTPPAWASAPHSWQQIQLNSPEGERRYRFRDLVGLARECAGHGVRAIQLVGWNDGGQDQNNPSHDPDPALGGADELRRAIAACQDLGVKIVLFSKFVWADRATDRFRRDLIRLAVKDPYGDYYQHPGYRYQTVTQLLDVNTRRLIPMCFASPEWIRLCREEFQKVLDSGADGMLYDECFHHMPALACFDPGHGHRYGQPVYAHDVDFVRWLREQSDPVRPEFLYSGEACTDWQLAAYHLSYHRSEALDHIPLMRYLRPDALLMTAVTGFDDRGMINQCLLYRYVVSYEPYNFKGRLSDMPRTVGYGQQMDALRTGLREWLWDGEFQDTLGAQVTERGTGRPHAPFAVFRSTRDSSLAVVAANYGTGSDVVVDVAVPEATRPHVYRLVDDDRWREAAGGVRLPPRSAAVILEDRPAPGQVPWSLPCAG